MVLHLENDLRSWWVFHILFLLYSPQKMANDVGICENLRSRIFMLLKASGFGILRFSPLITIFTVQAMNAPGHVAGIVAGGRLPHHHCALQLLPRCLPRRRHWWDVHQGSRVDKKPWSEWFLCCRKQRTMVFCRWCNRSVWREGMPCAAIFLIIAKNRDSAKMLAAGDADSAFRCLGQVECCLCPCETVPTLTLCQFLRFTVLEISLIFLVSSSEQTSIIAIIQLTLPQAFVGQEKGVLPSRVMSPNTCDPLHLF